MSVNDPAGYEEKYRRARERLETADIDDEDRRAIEAYIENKEASGDHEYSTLESYTTVLIRAAKMTHRPLTEWEDKDPQNGRYQSDYDTFMQGLRTGDLDGAKDGGYSEEYRRSFRQNLKPFFRYIGRDFSEDIDIGQPSKGEITESDCFNSDETSRMFQVADTRDAAILALWLATGQRASAMASLRLDDVEFTENRGRFMLNPNAIGLKGAKGWRPMLWASPYVKEWVNSHPAKDQEDAPLFCTKRNGHHYDLGDGLSYDGIKRVVESLCERAEIPDHKAQTHRFRHTAIRRMIRDGLSDQQIKFMVGWHEDSSQLARYGSLQDKTHSDDIEDEYGYETDDEEEIGIELENCPKCSTPLTELVDAAYCPSCGLPLSHSVEETERAAQDTMKQGFREVDPESDLADKVEALDSLLNDDEIKQLMHERMNDDENGENGDE